ncbi:hypothetical protein QAD02_012301 [Eretmocerus hayati]|uniref:Uncharacterized protein n=1 Tax=Eretmocerus hayati TaxID=131215 RepID=A0ACC2NZJ2_9HYME|nr:hypothetical protein QAD02_012301 [Eretmocerus hayati]
MIGPSGSGSADGGVGGSSGNAENGKRRILDELAGIDGFCDELCTHHHHEHIVEQITTPASKRPRIVLASELEPSILMLGDAASELLDMPSLQYSSTYLDTIDDDQQQQQHHRNNHHNVSHAFHQLEEPQQQLTAESLTRLEVLVVDHANWHDAFEAIDVGEHSFSTCVFST